MKKISFLLVGTFLLGTITFALADETKDAETRTGTTTEAQTGSTLEITSGNTTEVVSGSMTEIVTGDTVETNTGIKAETTEVMTGDTIESTTGDTLETDNIENDIIIPDSVKDKYSEEQIEAYKWAFNNGITTIANVEDARLADGLTRAELAKMMSQYLTRVLGGAPAIGEVEYSDVDESLGDLVDYIKMAYAYKIMGVNVDGTPLEEFNPNGIVTRAEFATVFSRVLYGDNYNRYEGNYYEGHLIALKNAGILTNISPTIQEVRGWVMLMMYRSTNHTSEKPEEGTVDEGTGEVVGIANPASEYCVAQGGTVNNVKDAEGNESGICKLSDGTEIDEWDYYRANNPENSTGNTVEIPEETDGTGEVMSGSTLTITVTPG